MMKHIINWIMITLAVFVTATIVPGIEIDGIFAAFVVAIVLGIINVFIKPVLLVLTLPINIISLGLFTFIINALLVILASVIVQGFEVNGFWWALLFSIVLSLVQFVLHAFGKK